MERAGPLVEFGRNARPQEARRVLDVLVAGRVELRAGDVRGRRAGAERRPACTAAASPDGWSRPKTLGFEPTEAAGPLRSTLALTAWRLLDDRGDGGRQAGGPPALRDLTSRRA
ncbi:hypothetical protein [Streptomyces sp. BE20]|uniref:hypothetical protein n=1 Tax=Streptomyces sp. BE20 TaxID=3002525 RepID=UPI003FA6A84F